MQYIQCVCGSFFLKFVLVLSRSQYLPIWQWRCLIVFVFCSEILFIDYDALSLSLCLSLRLSLTYHHIHNCTVSACEFAVVVVFFLFCFCVCIWMPVPSKFCANKTKQKINHRQKQFNYGFVCAWMRKGGVFSLVIYTTIVYALSSACPPSRSLSLSLCIISFKSNFCF